MDSWLIGLSATIGVVAGGIVWGRLWRMRIRQRQRQAYIETVRPIGNRLAPYQVLQSNPAAHTDLVVDLTEIEDEDHPVAKHVRASSNDSVGSG